MKLEVFFEKFDQFADASNAVDEFRKIILHLAVHGSLVEQSDKDEPASEMLQRLSDRKPSLLESADLPKAWENVALGDLLTLQKGKKPSSLNTEGVGLPYLDIAALERGELRQFTEDEKCPRAALGDLVIVCDGSRSGLVLDGVAGVLGSTVSKVRYAGFVRDYLKLFLRSLYDDLNGAKKGAAIPHLNIPRLLAIPAPIPPLAEQKRIVAKVDELMALCDRLAMQQQERETRHAELARASLACFADAPTRANLPVLFHPSYHIPPADLRKSILTLAVRGKLVPQDPNDKPAQPAVAQIEKERERMITAKQFRRSQLPGPIDKGPFDIPETWAWTHLGNAMLNVTDGFHSTPKTVESGVRYVTAKHVKPGLIDFDSCLYVSEDDFKEIASKTRPRKGDILVVNIGAGSGLASIIEADFEFAFKNVAILNRPEEVDSKFLFNYLVFKRDDIFEEQTKGGAQPFLSLGLIREIPFPIPPLAEQRRIVTKVDQLMALVDELETHLAASRATAANLLAALVAELTGTTSDRKMSPQSDLSTGRRGRPRKSP